MQNQIVKASGRNFSPSRRKNNAGTILIQTEMESLLYGSVVERVNIDIGP